MLSLAGMHQAGRDQMPIVDKAQWTKDRKRRNTFISMVHTTIEIESRRMANRYCRYCGREPQSKEHVESDVICRLLCKMDSDDLVEEGSPFSARTPEAAANIVQNSYMLRELARTSARRLQRQTKKSSQAKTFENSEYVEPDREKVNAVKEIVDHFFESVMPRLPQLTEADKKILVKNGRTPEGTEGRIEAQDGQRSVDGERQKVRERKAWSRAIRKLRGIQTMLRPLLFTFAWSVILGSSKVDHDAVAISKQQRHQGSHQLAIAEQQHHQGSHQLA